MTDRVAKARIKARVIAGQNIALMGAELLLGVRQG
jgi:hypothetical protein